MVRADYALFRDHLLGSRVFQAQRALQRLHATAEQARTAIAASAIDPQFSGPALQTVSDWQASAQDSFQAQQNAYLNAELVRDNFETQTAFLAAACRDADARKALDCTLLRNLVAVPAASLHELTDDQLRFVEDSLERVKRGPRFVAQKGGSL